MQVVVIGDAGCGKTNLIRAVVGLEFDDNSPPTDRRTSYSLAESRPIQLVDCGLIEDEVALGSLLKHAQVAVVAYDCSEYSTFESIKSVWLSAVKAACRERNVLIVVAGCKADMDKYEVSLREVERFAAEENIFFVETSARERNNIDLLLNILKLRLFHEPARQIPKSPSQPLSASSTHYQQPHPVRMTQSGQANPTTLLIHRTGSVDLTSRGSGINFHLTREGALVSADANKRPLDKSRRDSSDVDMFPLMVDVKLAGGNVGSIVVESASDDPLELAQRFLRENGLDLRKSGDLAKVIKRRLEEYYQGMHGGVYETDEGNQRLHRGDAKGASPSSVITNPQQAVGVSHTSSLPIAPPPPPKGHNAILARLNIIVDAEITTVIAVRQGDDASRVVEAFRKTYGLSPKEPVVQELFDKIVEVLQVGIALEDTVVIGGSLADKELSTRYSPDRYNQGDRTYAEQETKDATYLHGRIRLPSSEVPITSQDFAEQNPPWSRPSQARAQQGQPWSQQSNMMMSPDREREYHIPTQSVVSPERREPDYHSSRGSINLEKEMMHQVQQRPIPTTPSHPPPPPPSKYTKMPSPIPYQRTPQTPIAPRTSPAFVRSQQSPASRPSPIPKQQPVYKPSPLSSTASPSKRVGRPLFYVDVNLGGKSERVAVHKGDNLAEVAEKFLAANSISKTKTLKLTQLLEYHMRLHLQNKKRA